MIKLNLFLNKNCYDGPFAHCKQLSHIFRFEIDAVVVPSYCLLALHTCSISFHTSISYISVLQSWRNENSSVPSHEHKITLQKKLHSLSYFCPLYVNYEVATNSLQGIMKLMTRPDSCSLSINE